MTRSTAKLRLVHDEPVRGPSKPDVWAMPPEAARATHEPSPRSRPSRVSVDYRGASATVRPMFTTRNRKPPLPVGHRTYFEGRR